ncbi:Methylenetetrahydrofolate reductase 1 [Datura stramonium]|uniref:Methylenetetrahydrofolate reductase 1 n=1 Tax=Datura stramonium TaxID=4076 RepID=A0ABS8RKX4_DATST|nr:Methylenetetrahydrofolate reductase 1 [Datura stramonium]
MEKSALAILMNLGLIEESKISRPLPWRRPQMLRVKEDVRPTGPKSYISRTIGWDEYPHGHGAVLKIHHMEHLVTTIVLVTFVISDIAALSLSNSSCGHVHVIRNFKRNGLLPHSVEDIYERFMNYCLGKLRSCPWSDQPAVNGAKSDAPLVGWGGPGGYVYQKAYFEFLFRARSWNAVVEKCEAFPFLTYMAINKKGNWISNVTQTGVNAVTWGASQL